MLTQEGIELAPPADRYPVGASSNTAQVIVFQLISAVSDYHEKISVHVYLIKQNKHGQSFNRCYIFNTIMSFLPDSGCDTTKEVIFRKKSDKFIKRKSRSFYQTGIDKVKLRSFLTKTFDVFIVWYLRSHD